MTMREPLTPENLDSEENIRRRAREAYRLTSALVTARDDKRTRHRLIQLAIDDMPQNTSADIVAIVKMLAVAVGHMTEYVRAMAEAYDSLTHEGAFHEQFMTTIRPEMLED